MNKIKLIVGLCTAIQAATFSACVSSGANRDADLEPVSAAPVAPAQLSPEECVNYVQLKRDEDYQCELADGTTRPLKPGERRTSPLSRDEIEQVIRKNNDDALDCFDSHLPKDVKVTGKLYVSFEIESDGKVSEAHYNESKSTYKNPKLAACLVEKVKTWRFPILQTDETLQINYPFQLISADSDSP